MWPRWSGRYVAGSKNSTAGAVATTRITMTSPKRPIGRPSALAIPGWNDRSVIDMVGLLLSIPRLRAPAREVQEIEHAEAGKRFGHSWDGDPLPNLMQRRAVNAALARGSLAAIELSQSLTLSSGALGEIV